MPQLMSEFINMVNDDFEFGPEKPLGREDQI